MFLPCVLDMLDVTATNTLLPPLSTLRTPSPLLLSLLSLYLPPTPTSLPSPFLFLSHTPLPTHTFHHLLPTYPTAVLPKYTPSVFLTNHSSYPTCAGCSLQVSGSTALMLASQNGHTETVPALLAAPGIDVNHVNVSIYPLTPSHVVVRGEGGGRLNSPYPPHSNPRTNVLSPTNLENVPHH